MRGFWAEENWTIDRDVLVLPNGHRLTLASIRDWRARLLVGEHDLTATWSGWRVRQQWLIPPGGSIRRGRISERRLRHLVQMDEWRSQDVSRRQLPLF